MLNHVRDEVNERVAPEAAFFLRRRRPGVYVLRVADSGGNQHAICIDNREEPGLIYDSSEEYAMILSGDSLRVCVEKDTEYSGVDDIRAVVQNGEYGSRKRRSKPGSSARRKDKPSKV